MAQAAGCDTVITGADISTGSGRSLAAALSFPRQPDFVVNLQGDSPFQPTGARGAVIVALEAGAQVATPVIELDWPALDARRDHKTRSPFSGTTCARAPDGHAFWCSKAIIPAIRDEAKLRDRLPRSPVWRHVGLYGYTLDAPRRVEAMIAVHGDPPSLVQPVAACA